jgi:hypothetical protein
MASNVETITATVTVLVLVGAVAIRSLSAGRIEIKLNDAIIAAIAAALVLLVAGRITKFGLSPEGLTLETATQAILSASARPIEQQVSKLPVAPVEVALKGGVGAIPSLVRQQVQGLEFVLGGGGYDPNAIKQFLETLTQHSFFRYVVLVDSNLRLFGMLDARRLLALLQEGPSPTFDSFAMMLNRGNADDRTQLQRIPGFVPSSAAVTQQTDKRDVLTKMEELGIDWLPVKNADGKLDGVVDRSRLTTSLILDVTNQLRASAPVKQ